MIDGPVKNGLLKAAALTNALIPIAVLFLVGWMFLTERRVTSLESNNFSVVDGQRLWEQIAILNQSPAQWFVLRVDRLELKLDEAIQAIREIEKRQ